MSTTLPGAYASNQQVQNWAKQQYQQAADAKYKTDLAEYQNQSTLWLVAASHARDISVAPPPLPTIPLHHVWDLVDNQLVESFAPMDPTVRVPILPPPVTHTQTPGEPFGPGFGPALSPDPVGDALAYVIQLLLQIRALLTTPK